MARSRMQQKCGNVPGSIPSMDRGIASCRMGHLSGIQETEDSMAELYSTGKLAETLKIPAGKLKKLIDELKLQPDSVKGACKYYGDAALKKLKAAAK
jgi:hypothetical protein